MEITYPAPYGIVKHRAGAEGQLSRQNPRGHTGSTQATFSADCKVAAVDKSLTGVSVKEDHGA